MKKVKPSSKPLMALNMKMAGRGVLIGGSMRLNKKRCASTERLGSLIKQGIAKNQQHVETVPDETIEQKPVDTQSRHLVTQHSRPAEQESTSIDASDIVEQLKGRLHDVQSQLHFVQSSSNSAIQDLQNLIAELREQNQYLKRRAESTIGTVPQGNSTQILRMETSLLKCDLAAARSELVMCHKHIQRLEKQIAERPTPNTTQSNFEVYRQTVSIDNSEALSGREFGKEITQLHLNASNRKMESPPSKPVTASNVASRYESSVSFTLSESGIFDFEDR